MDPEKTNIELTGDEQRILENLLDKIAALGLTPEEEAILAKLKGQEARPSDPVATLITNILTRVTRARELANDKSEILRREIFCPFEEIEKK